MKQGDSGNKEDKRCRTVRSTDPASHIAKKPSLRTRKKNRKNN